MAGVRIVSDGGFLLRQGYGGQVSAGGVTSLDARFPIVPVRGHPSTMLRGTRQRRDSRLLILVPLRISVISATDFGLIPDT